jgi:hypothetical protein
LLKHNNGDGSQGPASQRLDSKRKINYEGLLAYTDRSHKREIKAGQQEESGKKLALTAREPAKSTTDFTRIKDSEYILKASSKPAQGTVAKKKLSMGSTESLNFKRKKFSLQTSSKVGAAEKQGVVERPQTGSTLAAMAYGTSSGIFLKHSVLTVAGIDHQTVAKKKSMQVEKKPAHGSLSARSHQPLFEGSLFAQGKAEYQRGTQGLGTSRHNEEYLGAPGPTSSFLAKARLSKPELQDRTKASRTKLLTEPPSASKGSNSGALTDRSGLRDSKAASIGQRSNVLVRVNTANLVQGSKFNKHIAENSKREVIDTTGSSGMGKKSSSKLIVIGEAKSKKPTKDQKADFLTSRTRKSAIELNEGQAATRKSAKPQASEKEFNHRKEIKSILEEINLMNRKAELSVERPASNNKPRKSPLNKKPLY